MFSNPESAPRLPLLNTKISVPLLPAEFVHRHRLTDRISQGVKGPLTLVSAPAGFGKTNLVIEWAAETKSSVAWLTIDEEDNDPGRFFLYLISAVQAAEPDAGAEALDFIQSAQGRGLEVGLTLLINDISVLPQDLILVLDEFQVLESASICQGLDFLLKHLPRNLHLVIASRHEPALDLASLRAKGKLVELGADDLRFTGDEIALFFRETTGFQLPPEIISTLERNTDGWITGLQMAAISLRHRPEPAALDAELKGDAHYLADFLATEVLDRQPEDIRQFLLQSSVLDQFCGQLCEAVIQPRPQPGYGAVMLDRLEHANLFIVALDDKHEWFRYHHLFSEFLRHALKETSPADVPSMQKRAALWFEEHGDLNEALKYALAVGDAEWAADLIERNVERMIKTGEVFALTHWIGMLPDEIIHRRPGISLTYAWGLIAAYRLDAARYWLDDIQKELGPIDGRAAKKAVNEDQANAGLWNMYGGLAVCRSTLALLSGNTEQAAEFSRDAASYLQEDNPFVSSMLFMENSMYFALSGDTSKAVESLRRTVQVARQANNLLVLVIAICQLAEMQALQGQLSQALVTLQKAQLVTTNPDGSIHPLAGLVDIGFGEILLERDVLDQALEYLERGCRVTKGLWSLSSLDGMVSLARLRQIRGDVSGSQDIIEEASRMALSTESSQWDDAMVSALAARLALQREDLANATQWWKKGGLPDPGKKLALEQFPYHILEYLQLTQVRFMLARSRAGVDERELTLALELLASVLRAAKRFKRVTSQIEILVLQSIAQYEMKNMDAAAGTLLGALALGEPEDYRRIFLDGGRAIVPILVHCAEIQQASTDVLPSQGYIESLLDALQPARGAEQARALGVQIQDKPATARTEYGLPISLSAREMQVLSLIAEGKSNQEIATQLYLALNTVKRHAYNIYSKLEVKKRTHAVLKARQLGLIP